MKTQIPLYLKPEQRSHLQNLLHSGKELARVQTRARILLLTDRSTGQGRSDEQIAQVLLCSHSTVGNIRRRFLDEGMQAALSEKPRPGRAPKITGDIEAAITVLACSDPPDGYGRWTMRLLADRVVELDLLETIHHTTIWDRLKKTNSNPGKSNPG